jgi:Glu-tRNA(Gln) amidotransferase subunit E-like FAD-binding protein
LRVEIYSRIKEDVARWLEHIVEELRRNSINEKTVKSIAKAIAAQEFARLHSIVMEEFNEFKAEVEERLSKYGIDAETIRRIVDEVYGKLLNDVKQLFDQRIMHVLDAINEQSSSIRDVLDLVNELLKAEAEFEEELAKLRDEIRSMLSEERVEELLYRTLVKRGVIRQRRRRWAPLIAGLSVLAAIIASFIINPIVTFVIIAIAIVILLRW